jgi:GntR family transcriptional repressor for pyruvate dehydrogenase complex
VPQGQTQTAPEQIADRILAAVAVGVLQPGERLPDERSLAAQLMVSRTTIRQALARLSALGITWSRPGRGGGTFVGMPDAASAAAAVRILEPIRLEFESLLEYRALIEQLVARTAAARHQPQDDAAMRAALEAYTAARTVAEARAADAALHSAVAAAAGNAHLAALVRELRSRVNLGFAAEPYTASLRETALHQHAELVAAVIASDEEQAARLAGEHFQLTTAQAWRSALGGDAGPGAVPVTASRLQGRLPRWRGPGRCRASPSRRRSGHASRPPR